MNVSYAIKDSMNFRMSRDKDTEFKHLIKKA